MARPRSALSKFILSLPSNLSVKEVIAKAKAKGMRASTNNVYRVRRLAAKTAKATPTVVAKTSKAATPARTPTSSAKAGPSAPAQSKMAFIRSLPKTMSARDAVKAGAAKGVRFDVTYVYAARRSTKGSEKRGRAAIATSGRNGSSVSRPITTTSSAEALLRAVAAEIGLGRAVEILQGERARVVAVIGG